MLRQGNVLAAADAKEARLIELWTGSSIVLFADQIEKAQFQKTPSISKHVFSCMVISRYFEVLERSGLPTSELRQIWRLGAKYVSAHVAVCEFISQSSVCEYPRDMFQPLAVLIPYT